MFIFRVGIAHGTNRGSESHPRRVGIAHVPRLAQTGVTWAMPTLQDVEPLRNFSAGAQASLSAKKASVRSFAWVAAASLYEPRCSQLKP